MATTFGYSSEIDKADNMQRANHLRRLEEETFDLCIIGGGASGAGCALEASLQGLKVALIEKTDFAAETSSRSTKLIHGGVRYLEQAFKNLDFAQLRQVRHGLRERHILLKNAPHLAKPLGLITPVFSWWEGFYFSAGLKLYDWIAGKKGQLPPSRWLSRAEAIRLMPGISPSIHSAVLYYDGQLDDARYCLALVQSAAECQAAVANHVEVVDFQKDTQGKIISAIASDLLTPESRFPIKASLFINCTGPFADQIRLMANPDLTPRISPSKGVHLVLPASILKGEYAMLIPKTKDGRMVFAIPFEGSLLLGTTDEPYTTLEKEPILKSEEVDFLLETLQPFVSQVIDKKQISSGFGGIRPLIKAATPDTKSGQRRQTKTMLRDHEVELDESSGLVSLLGGKWTTYRLMARDTIREAFRLLNGGSPKDEVYLERSEQHALFGTAGYSSDLWKKLQASHGYAPEICQHLASKYGGAASKVLEIAQEEQELGHSILPNRPFIQAEIVYAVRWEMAVDIRDFLARRIRLEMVDWKDAQKAAPIVAYWMGRELGWSANAQQTQLDAYLDLLNHFIQTSTMDQQND